MDSSALQHGISSSWPDGVSTYKDMLTYAQTLFGECEIENLLTDTPFDGYLGCYLIRAKGACNQDDWQEWPGLMVQAMDEIQRLHEGGRVIEVKSKVARGPLAHLRDTLQVTTNGCTCRVPFGGDKTHKKLDTSSAATVATMTMERLLMERVKPNTYQWDETQHGYHTKAFHLVLNRYNFNEGMAP